MLLSLCCWSQREDDDEEREYLLRLGGVRDRERGDLRRGGERRLMGGGERRRILPGIYLRGERQRGGGPLRCIMGGGERRRGGICRGMSTGAAVISWPSTCPPSMCFMAFSASSGFSKSM